MFIFYLSILNIKLNKLYHVYFFIELNPEIFKITAKMNEKKYKWKTSHINQNFII